MLYPAMADFMIFQQIRDGSAVDLLVMQAIEKAERGSVSTSVCSSRGTLMHIVRVILRWKAG